MINVRQQDDSMEITGSAVGWGGSSCIVEDHEKYLNWEVVNRPRLLSSTVNPSTTAYVGVSAGKPHRGNGSRAELDWGVRWATEPPLHGAGSRTRRGRTATNYCSFAWPHV